RSRQRATAWFDPASRQEIRDRLYSVADYHAEDNRLAAAWVAQRTPADSRVFVYGFTPEIYVAASRQPASRFIYHRPLRAPWSRDEARAELMRSLTAAPPAAVLVEHGDLVADVVGGVADSAADLASFTELRAFLDRRYAVQPRIGKFDVYALAQ